MTFGVWTIQRFQGENKSANFHCFREMKFSLKLSSIPKTSYVEKFIELFVKEKCPVI
jgi:hypothetical protein